MEKFDPFWKTRQYNITEIEDKVVFYRSQGYSIREIEKMKDIPIKKTTINKLINKHKFKNKTQW
jgi:hypothetical protein